MKKLSLISLVLVGTLVGCTSKAAYPDVKDNVRTALDSHGWKDVSVAQDRDKGVVTLSGHLTSEADKTEAASVAQGVATGQVVSNEIVVMPPDAGSDVKKARNDLDDSIDREMKALFEKKQAGDDVNYDVKAGVVTLTGSVASPARRAQVEKDAKNVPNVAQVVNELQVKNQKATTSRGSGK
jgi:hyperosmotically inducible protein